MITLHTINLRETFEFWKRKREIFSNGTRFFLIMWAKCHTLNYPAWYINGKHWFQLWGHVLLIQISDTGCKPPFYHVKCRWLERTWDQKMGLFIMLLKLNLCDTERFSSSLKWKGNCQPENHMSNRAVIFFFPQYLLNKSSNTVAGKKKKARKCKQTCLLWRCGKYCPGWVVIEQIHKHWLSPVLVLLCQPRHCLWEVQRLGFGEAWDKRGKCLSTELWALSLQKSQKIASIFIRLDVLNFH